VHGGRSVRRKRHEAGGLGADRLWTRHAGAGQPLADQRFQFLIVRSGCCATIDGPNSPPVPAVPWQVAQRVEKTCPPASGACAAATIPRPEGHDGHDNRLIGHASHKSSAGLL
jgi:hypothetical protein